MQNTSIFKEIGGKKGRIYRVLYRLAQKNRRIVLLNLFLSICTSFLVVVPNWMKEIAFDRLTEGLFGAAMICGILFTVLNVLGDGVDLFKNYVSQKMTKDLAVCAQLEAADFIQRLPLQTTSGANASELMMHQMEVMSGVGNLILSMMNILMLLLTSLTAFGLAFRIDPVMTVCAFLIVEPVRIALTRRSSEKLGTLVSGQQEASKKVWRVLTENFQHLYYIKAQNIWQERRAEAEQKMLQERNLACGIARRKSVFSFLSFLMANLVTGAALLRSMARTYHGEISFGQLAVILSYFMLLQSRLSMTVTSVLNFAAEKRKLEEKLDFYACPMEEECGKGVGEIRSIAFENVRFSYENTEAQVFDRLSARFSRGECIAVAGKNGGGKSTFLNLLLGLYQPDEGAVFVDGVPMEELSKCSLRGRVGYLPQTPVLFSGTVRENLLLGNGRTSRENPQGQRKSNGRTGEDGLWEQRISDDRSDESRLLEICRALGMEEWLDRLPDGLDTFLENPQQTLSGGERQRITLARALLEERSVYLLDEPTSALDQRTKELLWKLIDEKRREAIVIVVTHDEWLLEKADQVLRIGADVRQGGVNEIRRMW